MDNALEIHAHYSKLFEAFAVLPPDDIRAELHRESVEHYSGGHYHVWRMVLQRLRNYLGKSTLDSRRHAVVIQFIDSEEAMNEIELPYPECRVFLRETDRTDLKARFIELAKGQKVPTAGHWVMGIDNQTPDEIQELCPPILNEETKNRIEVIKQRLTILDERKAPSVYVVPTKREGADFISFLPSLFNIKPGKPTPISPHPVTQAPAPIEPLDTPAFTVIKSQAQVLSEMIAQIATDAEASANAKGFTLVGKPGNPIPPAPPAPATTETPQPGSPPPAVAPSEAFTQLLLNYSLAELRTLLTDLGLLDKGTGQASPVASPGAWVGIIHALIDEQRPRLRGSKAAIWRAFSRTFGAVVSERSVQYGLGTNQSEAEQFRDRALSLLKA